MAQYFPGKTTCPLCDQLIDDSQAKLGFTAFLPTNHRWHKLSDAVVHADCMAAWRDSAQFTALYAEFREIWQSIPRHLAADEQENWLKAKLEVFNASAALAQG
jgi:hypothetical protein